MEKTSKQEIFRVKLKNTRLPRFAVDFLQPLLQRLLGFSQFNEIYGRVPPCSPIEMSTALLDTLGIRLEVDGEPLAGVPADGPLIIVANHPSGMVDGFAMDAATVERRPDSVLMAVNNLAVLPGYGGRMIFVGPRGRHSRRRHSLKGWRQAFTMLEQGGTLGVFPAGGVSRFTWRRLRVCDPPWTPHIAALALRTRATVLPLYLHAHNRFYFHLVGAICKPLQDVMILGEMAKMRGRTLRVTLGKVIPPQELERLHTKEEAIAFMQARVEELARR